MNTNDLLKKDCFTTEEIVYLLGANGNDKTLLFESAARCQAENVQNKVYLRGLIEFTNCCSKNCLYCGIRSNNRQVKRYTMTDKEIMDAVRFAWESRYGSVVLQSGELISDGFTRRVEKLLRKIERLSDGKLRVTLSCGEQSYDTYRRWFENGASRYLLRIESSNPELYKKLHPDNQHHRFETRMKCLEYLKKAGYQVGTGVMIGLPFQTMEDLAHDLLFMKQIDVDMVGMGPYLEHLDTPLYACRHQLLSKENRFQLALKMIAVLRLLMKDINIAATTALQAIDPMGREKALKVGANIIMPNITPGRYQDFYTLYENMPCTAEDNEDYMASLEALITLAGHETAYGEWGDSEHYRRRDKGQGTRKKDLTESVRPVSVWLSTKKIKGATVNGKQ
ncbi:MAG: [FeFe] hydrogenase H-cluster radical SAM maturase HydE [Bacteroidales bacterium]|nr:[FeFe] hydrogenase H-cluster radical SAM maturase HydE [Bacteroidales bacterium]